MSHFNKKQVWSLVASVAVSVFAVALVASATTYIDTSSVGVASSTVGAAVAVKGAAIFEGFASADYFTSTSSNPSWLMGGGLGIGTTSPGVSLAVKGGVLSEGFVSANYFTSTSTNSSWIFGKLGLGSTTPGAQLSVNGTSNFAGIVTVQDELKASYLVATSSSATSTIGYGLTVFSTALVADANSSSLGIGTSTFPVVSGDTKVTVSVGGGSASTTLFLAGGKTVGSSIIIGSANGQGCVAITANRGDADADGAVPLTARVIPCPTP